MKNCLFASDMDGTLLNDRARVSDRTRALLAPLFEKGLLFTVATGRTPATAYGILKALPSTLPAITMNGALIWDMQRDRAVRYELLPQPVLAVIAEALRRHRVNSYAFGVPEGCVLPVYYADRERLMADEFVQSRLVNPRKSYRQNFWRYEERECIGFTTNATYEELEPLYKELLPLEGIKLAFYKNTYREKLWFLEIVSSAAGKDGGIRYVRSLCGAERVCVFGDNGNDLTMLAVADRSFAVANAQPSFLEAADERIPSNEEDGVALTVARLFGEGLI